MNDAKTPAEIAKIFGCTEDQAREHIRLGVAQLKASAEKARSSKTGKLRGLTAEWYENRAAAFEAVL